MTPDLCAHPGCARPRNARGLCTLHYQRAKKGAPLDAPPFATQKQFSPTCPKGHLKEGIRVRPSGHQSRYCKVCAIDRAKARYTKRERKPLPSLEERFGARSGRRGPDECWEWTGAIDVYGYGVFRPSRALMFKAHRYALELKLGRPIGDGLCACHRCDNPPCVNPAHLFEGSRADNNADMRSKGREHKAFGENAGKAKLTEAQVLEIRRRFEEGARKSHLAAEFGIHNMSVHFIVIGKTWRHLLPEAPR